MDEEYEDSMDDEKCENCTYYRNNICLRKAGADQKICGQMIIDFVYMCENEQLILMVHCEAEKAFGGSKYDNSLYSEVGDEAYSNYMM